jgi:hypothetical protein
MKRVWGYNHLEPEFLGVRRCQNQDGDPLLNDVEQTMVVASPKAGTLRWRAVEWP